jgi:hypothetical protein
VGVPLDTHSDPCRLVLHRHLFPAEFDGGVSPTGASLNMSAAPTVYR